jgi:hypothetical protein
MFSLFTCAVIASIAVLIVVAYASDEKDIALMRALNALRFGWIAMIVVIAYQSASARTPTWDIMWALLAAVVAWLAHSLLVAMANKRTKTK